MSLLFAVALLAADPAPAATPAPTPAPAVKEAAKEPRKICKRQAVSTSLYGSKRVCKTAEEWKGDERAAEYSDMGGVTTK